jgi:EmrB/QacA subfamily drug resistance transporter
LKDTDRSEHRKKERFMSSDVSTDSSFQETANLAEQAPRGVANERVRWGALALIMVGTFVTILDYFIANVASPSIQSDLHASSAQVQLIFAGYGVALTAGLITCGRLGDLYGRRRVFGIGLAVFTVASLACGLAPTATDLVLARIVQGVGAALLVPQVLGILGTMYTGEHRAKAFTAYGLVIGLAGVFGQLIGGALISLNIDGIDWRAVFLINVPIGLIGLLFIPKVLPKIKKTPGASLDLLGALLVTGALGLLVYCLVEGREQHWPVWSWAGLILAAGLALDAVIHLRRLAARGGQPLIDPSMFGNRTFSVGLAATITYFLSMGSFFLLFAFYLQQGRGLSALQSGLLFIALGSGYFGTSMLATPLSKLMGRHLVSVGPFTVAVGYGLVALTVHEIGVGGNIAWLIPGLLVAGFGMGMTTGPLTNTVLMGVDPQHAASASGAVNTAQEGGAAIGVAIAGTVFYPALGNVLHAGSYAHALQLALIPLMAFGILAAVIAQFLPRPEKV